MVDRICLRRAFLSSAEAGPLNVCPYSGLDLASARCAARRSCARAARSLASPIQTFALLVLENDW